MVIENIQIIHPNWCATIKTKLIDIGKIFREVLWVYHHPTQQLYEETLCGARSTFTKLKLFITIHAVNHPYNLFSILNNPNIPVICYQTCSLYIEYSNSSIIESHSEQLLGRVVRQICRTFIRWVEIIQL